MKDKPMAALDSCFLRGHSFYPPSYSFFGDLSNVMLVLSISFNPSRGLSGDWRGSQMNALNCLWTVLSQREGDKDLGRVPSPLPKKKGGGEGNF